MIYDFRLIALVLAALAVLSNAFVPSIAPVSSLQASFAGNELITNTPVRPTSGNLVMDGKSNIIRDRIKTVNNTKKITSAMKLVAAAKVRRAQDAVLQTRPFSETLQKIFGALIKQLGREFLDLPLLQEREVNKVVLVCLSGDRGLCGSYNSYAIKRTEQRMAELKAAGVEVSLITVGKKISSYFNKRDTPVLRSYEMGQSPTGADATAISEELLADFLSGECDSVELIYTRFVSLIASTPAVRTMLPLKPRGIETEGDEIFEMTSEGGQFSVKREAVEAAEPAELPKDLIFEQDPVQILNAILPLYLNGQILRTLQESVASELAARMQAMQSATDNAKSLSKTLTSEYNRARQAAVTQELLEIVAGATAAGES